MAIVNNDIDSFNMLIKHSPGGPDLEKTDERGLTAMHVAIHEGRRWAIKILHENGALLDSIATCTATCEPKTLEKHSTDPKCYAGFMPVHLAAEMGRVAVMECLLELSGKRVRLDSRADNKDGHKAIHFACKKSNSQMVHYLLKWGSNVSDLGLDGDSPLHTAAWSGNDQDPEALATAKLLIKNGADVNLSDKNGCTPMHVAAHTGYSSLSKLLSDFGGDWNARDGSGRTILHHAVLGGYIDLVKLVLERRHVRLVNERSINGRTALHIAADRGDREVIELLMNEGADRNSRDNAGNTWEDVARMKGHHDPIERI